MSVVHGGCGFPFLSKAVYEYLSCGKYTSIDVHLEDIPDPTLRFAIQKVTGAEDTAQLQATLAIDEIQHLLLQTGFNKPITSLTTANKEEMSRAIVDFHLMAKVKCIMDEGLREFGLLTKIKDERTLWEPMFVYSTATNITRDGLKALFTVLFSEKGSNELKAQEQAYVHFLDFLDECSGMFTMNAA